MNIYDEINARSTYLRKPNLIDCKIRFETPLLCNQKGHRSENTCMSIFLYKYRNYVTVDYFEYHNWYYYVICYILIDNLYD